MTTLQTAAPTLSDAQKNYEHDQARIRTRKAALLALLQDRDWHPNYELADVGGLSFNSYLYQLRLAGWEIVSRRIRGGVWEQRLTGREETPRRRDRLSGPQQQVADEFAVAVQKAYGEEGLNRIRQELSPWLTEIAAI
jgi:hypothetical protein